MSKVLSRTKRQLQDQETLHAVNASKFIALMVLRDMGYGKDRLLRFSDKFNELTESISQEYLSLTDIADTLYDEVKLSTKDLSIR